MLSWTKRRRVLQRGAGVVLPAESLLSTSGEPTWSFSAKTAIGTAIVTERPDGQALLDMWKPNQMDLGRGIFPNVDAAKTRAETILDPRATAWDMLDDPLLDDDILDDFDETG